MVRSSSSLPRTPDLKPPRAPSDLDSVTNVIHCSHYSDFSRCCSWSYYRTQAAGVSALACSSPTHPSLPVHPAQHNVQLNKSLNHPTIPHYTTRLKTLKIRLPVNKSVFPSLLTSLDSSPHRPIVLLSARHQKRGHPTSAPSLAPVASTLSRPLKRTSPFVLLPS